MRWETSATCKVKLLGSVAIIGIVLSTNSVFAQVTSGGDVTPPGISAGAGATTSTSDNVIIGSGGGVGSVNTNNITIENSSTLQVNQLAAPNGAGFDGARVTVGSNFGEGSLTIQSGGTLTIDNTNGATTGGAHLQISDVSDADAPSLQGVVTVNNGTIDVDSVGGNSLLSVGRDGAGTLNISNGSTINIDSTAEAGIQVGGGGTTSPQIATQGTMTVSGNSQIAITGGAGDAFLNVGRAGSNTSTLDVTGGSDIVISSSSGSSDVTIGRSGATGIATVDGAGSTITVGDGLNVGRGTGNGTLNIDNGGSVTNTAGSGLTRVGRSGGTGVVNVRTGSTLSATDLRLGSDSGSQGTVSVNGASTVNVDQKIQVGRESTGTLNVGDDPGTGPVETSGTVNGKSLVVGHSTTGTGTVNVNGGTAQVNLTGIDAAGDGALLQVGRVGTGTVNVSNGGNVTVNSGGSPPGLDGGLLLGGSGSNPATTGNGTLNVTGTGSTVTLSDGFTQVGRQGTGHLNITNGGVVDGSAQTAAVVARKAGSTGTVTVSGVGSTWLAGADLFVGTDVSLGSATPTGPGGTGLISVGNGGTLTATNVYIGATGTLTGSGGTINGDVTVDGGLFAPGASPGTMTINGDLTISTGVLQLEIEGGIADNIIVSGNVNIGGDVVLELYFDVIPAIIDIADFFGASDPVFGTGFDALDIMVFTSVGGNVGQSIDVTFGGTTETFNAAFGTTAVSAPGTLIIFAFGVFVALYRRQRLSLEARFQ